MTTALLSTRTYGNLVSRMFRAYAARTERRGCEARQKREMADLHNLPPHLLNDIGYYD